jgi:hypothetical protein
MVESTGTEAESSRLPAPRIVTVFGPKAAPLASPEDLIKGRVAFPEELLEPLHRCSFAVKESKLKPHFVLLAMHSAVLHECAFDTLTATVTTLLVQGYSVNIRLAPTVDKGSESTLFLLAAPCFTHPRWLDDALSDLRSWRPPIKAESNKMPTHPASFQEIYHLAHPSKSRRCE